MINCLIVDDEPLARSVIRSHLAHYTNWHIVAECIRATDAYEALHRYSVHVLFLDIQMPIVSGIEFLRSLKHPPFVVFTTAYSHYAVEGFELNGVDYLLKPITFERFSQAISRVEDRLPQPLAIRLDTELAPTERAVRDYIFIRQENKLIKVRFEDVLFLEAHRDTTKIYLKDDVLFANMHLKLLGELFQTPNFLRSHRSYIISLSSVQAIQGNRLEIGPYKVPIGSHFRTDVLEKLGTDNQLNKA